MLKIQIDDREFMKALTAFDKVSKKKRADVLRQTAKLVARDCMSFTPPNDKDNFFANKKGKVPWAKQKKIGVGAMLNDTLGKAKHRQNKKGKAFSRGAGDGGVFKVASSKTFKNAEKLNRTMGGDWHGMKHALWATKTGRIFGVEKNLYQPDASVGLMARHHNKYRKANTGRVSKGGSFTKDTGRHVFLDKMIVSIKSWNSYFKHLNKRLGRAKAGWLAAASRFKLGGVPKWVKQHGTSEGSVRDNSHDPIFPFVIMENSVPYIKRHDKDIRIVRKAMESQTHNLKVRTEKALEDAARKARLKG